MFLSMIIFSILRNDLLPLPIAGYTNQREFFQREKITVNERISGIAIRETLVCLLRAIF